MADPTPRRSRKPVNYRALLGGSDSEDDDFKERPSSSKPKRESTKNRLKLVGGNKENNSARNSDSNTSKLQPSVTSSHINPVDASKIVQSPMKTEFGEASVIIPEPDLSIHGISSQETVLLASSSESIVSEKPDIDILAEPEKSKNPPSGKKAQNNRRSRLKNLSDSDEEHYSSNSSDWGEETSKKRKKREDLKKRKLSIGANKTESKKMKVDSEVKAKHSPRAPANQTTKLTVNPLIQSSEKDVNPSTESTLPMEVPVCSKEEPVIPKVLEPKAQLATEEKKTSSSTLTDTSKEKSIEKKSSIAKTTSKTPKVSELLSEKRVNEEKTKEVLLARTSEKKASVGKMPVWNPPGKNISAPSTKVSNASPSTGLRLGLSRHGRFKPLHKTNALS